MPPIIDNPTDASRQDGGDEDWVRWEQTFRDARPVLPDAAMARIERSLHREIARAAEQLPSPWRRRLLFFVAILVSINGLLLYGIMHGWMGQPGQARPGAPGTVALIRDHYSLDVPIGPQLIVPDRPILPLAENWDLIGIGGASPPALPGVQVAPNASDLLKAAGKIAGQPPTGWHAMGLLEMRRVAGISGLPASPVSPHVDEFQLDACWRMLPLSNANLERFRAGFSRKLPADKSRPDDFWNLVFTLSIVRQADSRDGLSGLLLPAASQQFPGKYADGARVDLLAELGFPRTQAGLDVLTMRSYGPLQELQSLDSWPGAARFRDNLRDGYLSASHDLVERLFALKLLGRGGEADALYVKSQKLGYLNDPRELTALLARIGPADAWERLVRPLINDEVAFIENPPAFDDSGPRAHSEAVVEADTKSVREGVTTYSGSITLSAGPWRISCDKLTAFRGVGQASLLSGAGNVRVRGVMGLLSASADEATLNTEIGELKFAGRVRIEGWNESKELKSCTLTRTGELRDLQP